LAPAIRISPGCARKPKSSAFRAFCNYSSGRSKTLVAFSLLLGASTSSSSNKSKEMNDRNASFTKLYEANYRSRVLGVRGKNSIAAMPGSPSQFSNEIRPYAGITAVFPGNRTTPSRSSTTTSKTAGPTL
jgi:hypothetical protein